jgi:hypothetical protein
MSRRICVDLTAQNLDKKDLFSESDPFYLVYRTNEDGEDTLVYRSEWIKVTHGQPFYLVYRTNEDGEDTLVYRSEWIKVTHGLKKYINP